MTQEEAIEYIKDKDIINSCKDCTGVAETCPVCECGVCSVRECPERDLLHFHHDGCPCCCFPREEDQTKYKCTVCGIKNHKLWRKAASSYIELLCIRCIESCTTERLEVGSFLCTTDQIAGRVPAVPVDDSCEDWYGYTSVPEDRVKWWKGLPL